MYRQGIGAIILNKENKIFIAQRINYTNSWQLPQGGVNMGENITETFFREVLEETGIKKEQLKIITQTNKLRYDFPTKLAKTMWGGKYRGQEQTWFFAKFLGEEQDINLNIHDTPEFDDYKWIDITNLTSIAVDFKKDLYEKLVTIAKELKVI